MDDTQKPFLVTTSKDALPDSKVLAAQDFVSLVAEGATLDEAAEATGLSKLNAEVKKRLQELGIYAKLDNVVFRGVADARLKAIVLHGEDRDAITAVKTLYPEAPQAAVEIHLSPEIAKLDVTLPGFESLLDKEKDKDKEK